MSATQTRPQQAIVLESLLTLSYFRQDYLIDLVILLGLRPGLIGVEFGQERTHKRLMELKNEGVINTSLQSQWRGVEAILSEVGHPQDALEFVSLYHTIAENPKTRIDMHALIESFLNYRGGSPSKPITFDLAYQLARDYRKNSLRIYCCDICSQHILSTDHRQVGTRECCTATRKNQ